MENVEQKEKSSTESPNVFGTTSAAEYLNISIPTVKYHIYNAGTLKPDMVVGGRLIFTKETLDEFNSNKRLPGRPRKDE